MTILGYGEDGLTYWFLSQHLGLLMDRLGQGAATGFDASKCLILFRPSLGRRGGEGSCQLGEFDAIVMTPKDILLIESKWHDNPRSRRKSLSLKDNQSLRHTVFKSLREAWQDGNFAAWGDFVEAHRGGFHGRPLPEITSMLAENMHELLQMIGAAPGRVRDVLLLFHRSEQLTLTIGQELQDFDIVKVRYDHGRGGRYFPLPSVTNGPNAQVETVEVVLHE